MHGVMHGEATENEQLDNTSVRVCMDGIYVMEATVGCREKIEGEPFDNASE